MKGIARLLKSPSGPLAIAPFVLPLLLITFGFNISYFLGTTAGRLRDPILLSAVLITLFLATRWWHVLVVACVAAVYQAVIPSYSSLPNFPLLAAIAGAYAVIIIVGVFSPIVRLFPPRDT